MNGRLYDPKLGRFLSADVLVQYPDQTQSYNRYTYVNNNPLSYVDPSGCWFFSKLWKSIKKIIRPILAIAAMVFLPGAQWFTNIFGAFSNFAAGFIAGGISTGSIKGAFVGGLTASLFGALHEWNPGGWTQNIGGSLMKTLAHGAVGGLQSKLNGGKFASGFLSAGFTQAVSLTGKFFSKASDMTGRIKNAVQAAVVGGLGAVVAGGKFANGAITGTFSRYLMT